MRLVVNIKKAIKNFVFLIIEKLSPFLNENRPIGKTKIRKILVFEGGGIGDLLMLFPAINALKNNFQNATISFLAAPHGKEVIEMNPYQWQISEIILYDIKRKHRSFFRKLLMIYSIRRKGFDLIYAPSRGDGLREVPVMVFLMGAACRLGFTSGGTGLLNTNRIELSAHLPISEQNIALLEKSGINVEDKTGKIKVREQDILSAAECLGAYPKPFFVIHPSASWNASYKSWPLNNYIELISTLIERCRGSVILVGSKDEKEVGEDIQVKINNNRLINMIGMTSITQMAAIIHNAFLFIGNDSGPLQIACALKVPSIAIFGPTSPMQILSPGYECSVIRKDLFCSPCYPHQYDFVPLCKGRGREGECMEIPVSTVFSVVEAILTRNNLMKNQCCDVSSLNERDIK